MTKTEATRRLKSEVSQYKSRLLDVLRRMERDGLKRDADQLSNIIGRLEDWQQR
jgi:DNA polymerase I-like protein with 3'-5' exonuclease and polymerase domains